ncbi:MAG: hypothetical protein ABWY29_11200 [Blastococcus sp.]
MKRTLVLGSAWTASAAAAVGLGFLAVSLVDAEASPGAQPVAVTASSSEADDTPSASTSAPPPVAVSGEQATVGGTAFASCDNGVPVLASAPAAGWWVDDSARPGEVEFENGAEKVEVHVVCTPSGPQFRVEGPRTDDSRSGNDSSVPPASPTSGVDDSTGRVGGGHGSDDPPGDDSSGRDGGGHGSDD